MGPRHAHQISVAGSEDLLGELDAIEPADREDREIRDRSFDTGRKIAERRAREVHVGHLRRERVARVIGRVGDVDEVNGHRGDDARDDPLHVLERQAGAHEFLGADTDPDRVVRSHGLAHRAEYLEREAQSVLLAAADVGDDEDIEHHDGARVDDDL